MGKILIAGLGDKLRGDDGLGPLVIEKLKNEKLPENVEVEDFGSGVFALLNKIEQYEKIIVVDAIKREGNPGEVYNFELSDLKKGKLTNIHETKIDKIVLVAKELGVETKILIVGCEPKSMEYEVGLSKEVEKAIPEIIDLIVASIN